MSLTLPLRLQLWQSTGETDMTNVTSVSPISSPIPSPSIGGETTIGRFDMIKSKSSLDPTTKTPIYPTHIESTSTSLSSQPNIRRTLSLIDIPSHTSSLDNINTNATVYTPPISTRTLSSSPSWENLITQRMQDLRADQHRRRRRGVPRATYLYTGATYHGIQQVHHSGRDLSWKVHVRILGLDMRHGMCCGEMEAHDIPGHTTGVVTTYWEGQIIDNINHCFFTGRWNVTCIQDEICWTHFIAFAPLRSLVEQQQILIQQCYPDEENENENETHSNDKSMIKPDEYTAERIYAKLQQLKRLAQQPPPRVECSDDSLFTTSDPSSDDDVSVPSSSSDDISVPSVDSTPDVTPDTSSTISSTETSSDDDTTATTTTTRDDIIDEETSSGYDELACIAAHHRLTRLLNHSRYIFMRWKEISFDANDTSGLTIAGHYNVVMDRQDGKIIGIFQDQRTCNQRLVLQHVVPPQAQGQSFSEYHFHN